MPHQLALNVIAEINPDQVDTLKTKLGTIKKHVDDWNVIPFAKFSNIHFARLIVFEEARDLNNQTLSPRLALLTNYDAPENQHIKDLAELAGPGLDELFGFCKGYPDLEQITPAQRESFLRAHSRRSGADYINRQGRSVRQIQDEDALRQEIDRYLGGLDHSRLSASDVHREVIEFVRANDALKWALAPAEKPSLEWRVKERLHQLVVGLIVIILSPVLLLGLPVFLLLLRYHEKRDRPDTSGADSKSVQDFRDDEDYWVQNQIVAIGLIKPGLFRAVTTRVILGMTDYACRHIYNAGVLSGLNTIHFARWVALDDNKRLFFSSNYDGSLESYMNDFIDKAAWGLNAIFSNGDGFPRTRFLFCGGITDEKAYKRFLPTRQVHSRVWYSAYPHLTTKNIANNAAIRAGLSAQLNEQDAALWLSRFGVGNKLPESGWIARQLDKIDWGRICSSK